MHIYIRTGVNITNFDNYRTIHLHQSESSPKDPILLECVTASMDNPEVKATMLPQYVRTHLPNDMASYPRKTEYSATLL